jgi:hypothetical protein
LDVSQKTSKSFAFSTLQFFKYHQMFNQMNVQPDNSPKRDRINIVAASLCRGALALLHTAPRRHSAVATGTTCKILLRFVIATALSSIGSDLASAATISIMPSKDNTLYEYDPADGDTSNALGFHLFAGKTAMGELRRGVLAFDIAGSIPAGSTITGVTLSMNMSRTPISVAYPVELHKLLADWGEGTSQAPGEEGDGAPATPNDATWRHRFFDTIFWTAQGGDLSATVSASQSVSVVGPYTWSSPQMVADVQDWLDNPAVNFGWLVLGDEKPTLTTKRFDTRESANPPVLTIEYRPAGPRPTPTPRARPTPLPRPTAH